MPSEVNAESRLSIPPQVMSRLVGDETVLLDMSSGIYFGLDAVGQRIWESIAKGKTVSQTAASIAGEYDIEHTRAETDVIEFVGELLERGLLLRS